MKNIKLPSFVNASRDFDKVRDIRRVEPSSIIMLSEVISSGVIPATATDLEYNEVDNPDNVAGRVTNVFDAVDAQHDILSRSKPSSNKDSSNSSFVNPSKGDNE